MVHDGDDGAAGNGHMLTLQCHIPDNQGEGRKREMKQGGGEEWRASKEDGNRTDSLARKDTSTLKRIRSPIARGSSASPTSACTSPLCLSYT